MRRQTRLVLAVSLVAAAFVASCGEAPTAPEPYSPDAADLYGANTCVSFAQLNRLATAAYGRGGPNVHAVRGKMLVLAWAVYTGRHSIAVAQAHRIVDFTLKHFAAGRLDGAEADVTAFVNAIYCFAGIDIRINEPSNSHLILPDDQEQVVYSVDQEAAIRFEANPVSEPTMIEFQQVADTFSVPGAGPLDTKLDQYPGFLTITKSSETNAPLTAPAVVGVCAAGVIPQDVRDRLRLGHGTDNGVVVTEAADAGFLDCENLIDQPIGASGVRRALDQLLDFVQPTRLHARSATFFRGGGIGGTVTEFSPFAPVDPVLRSSGGIGGTITEFIRAPMTGLLLSESVLPVETCTSITGSPGAPVSEACRPFVRITTRMGTQLVGVPIEWAVTLGGGQVAAQTTVQTTQQCGVYAAMVLNPTDLFGRSRICWKLGEPGANQVTATPSAGGDVPPGVTFEPAVVTFDAQAVSVPAHLTLIEGNGQSAPAGVPTPVTPQVRVTDQFGNPLAGIEVNWEVREGTGSVAHRSVISDADGRASSGWTLGAGYNKLKAFVEVPFLYVYFEGTGR